MSVRERVREREREREKDCKKERHEMTAIEKQDYIIIY